MNSIPSSNSVTHSSESLSSGVNDPPYSSSMTSSQQPTNPRLVTTVSSCIGSPNKTQSTTVSTSLSISPSKSFGLTSSADSQSGKLEFPTIESVASDIKEDNVSILVDQRNSNCLKSSTSLSKNVSISTAVQNTMQKAQDSIPEESPIPENGVPSSETTISRTSSTMSTALSTSPALSTSSTSAINGEYNISSAFTIVK